MTALRIALALAVAGVALVACGGASSTPTPSASIVAWIGGQALTHAEFLDRRAIVAQSVASMERDLREVFPNPETDVEREQYAKSLKEWPARIAVLNRYRNDTVAFAELVLEYALAAAAIREGHTVSDDEKSAYVKEHSDNLDMMLEDPNFRNEAEQLFADSGGREAYLAKVTFSAERNLLIAKYLWASYECIGINPSVFGATGADLFTVGKAAVAAIEIELTGMPKIDTSPEKAIAYINEAESFASPSMPTPTATP